MKGVHNSTKAKPNTFTVTVFIVLFLFTVSLLMPILWAVLSSLKTRLEYLQSPFGLPKSLNFSNYSAAFQNFTVDINSGAGTRTVYIEEMLLYSAIYSVGSAFFATFISCITAYATSRFKFKFNAVIYGIVIVTMILPIVGSLPSEIQLVKSLGLYNNMIGMFILKANFLGMYYLIFYAVFKGIPKDFSDAACVDGASNTRILFTIMLPLASATFFTIMLIRFIEFWNDYQTPLVYLPSMPTIAYGLFEYSFSTKNAISSTPTKLAGSTLLLIPILIIFLAFHNRIMGNISMGGLKE